MAALRGRRILEARTGEPSPDLTGDTKMNSMRKVIGLLAAIAFAAFAVPATAQNVKYFKLTELEITGSNLLSAKFTNVDNGNSTFNAISLKSSGAVTFTGAGVTIDDVAVTASNIALADGGTKLIVTSLSPVKKGRGVVLKAAVSVPANGCLTWHGSAWTGSVSSPSQLFTQQNADPLLSIGTGCKLSITGVTSLVRGTTPTSSMPFSLTVSVTDGGGVPVPGVAVPFTLGGSSGCSLTSSGTTGTSLTGLVATLDAGTKTCTLTANTTSPSLTGSKTLAVYDGQLDCTDGGADALADVPAVVDSDGEFHGTIASGLTGYITGLRGLGDGKDENGDSDGACTLLNYTLTNNITGASSPDPNGNVVPAGFYGFSFDPSVPNPVVAIQSTYAPEWGAGDTGLPTRKTMVCTEVPCTTSPPVDINDPLYTGPWKVVPACLDTLIAYGSIPPGAPGACLASEGWVLKPGACTGTPPSGTYQRCLQVTTVTIIGTDPVFGR